MDIATHAGIGLVAAAPFLNSRPELAIGLVAGSVLPDLDALSRVFGKRAFLRSHQAWSHALPVQVAASALAGFSASACGAAGLPLAVGLFAGLAVHTLLDFSNTLGVKLLAPFSGRRFCLEWVFFIDAAALMLTAIATSFTLWHFCRNGEVPVRCAEIFFATMAIYLSAKGMLRRRAGTLAPEVSTVMPSALWPWRFFGTTKCGNCVRLIQINALSGSRKTLVQHEVLDAVYAGLLADVPEFLLMRELSPAYHVVSATVTNAGETVVCRDLRTRNFATTFGDLEVLLDTNQRVMRTTFHV